MRSFFAIAQAYGTIKGCSQRHKYSDIAKQEVLNAGSFHRLSVYWLRRYWPKVSCSYLFIHGIDFLPGELNCRNPRSEIWIGKVEAALHSFVKSTSTSTALRWILRPHPVSRRARSNSIASPEAKEISTWLLHLARHKKKIVFNMRTTEKRD